MTGSDHDDKSREKWNGIYRNAKSEFPQPCTVLTDHSYLVPASGRALDIACGPGGNALYMASIGLTTTAIDISAEGIDKLQEHAASKELEVDTIVAAVSEEYFAGNVDYHGVFDVIAVANYLDRKLFSILPDLLAPNGLLFYQTFVRDKANPESGPSNPEFLMKANELLSLTQPLVCRVFYDLGTVGVVDCGLRNQSCIVVQKGV